jgi:CBS domain-containing protein
MEYVARDIMNPKVIAVPATMDLRELGKLFLENGITGAPVLDEHGELAGVISQTDLVYYHLTRDDELVLDSSHFYQNARVEGQHLPAGFQIEDVNSGRVSDVMTPIVHAVTETASLRSIVRLMTRKHIHRVIVRRGRKVTGIISALDVLRALDRPAPRRNGRSTATKAIARSRRAAGAAARGPHSDRAGRRTARRRG